MGLSFAAVDVGASLQRGLDNLAYRQEKGGIPETSTVYCRKALSWVTTEGARMLKQQDRIGSITPGKQADLVLIDARKPNMQPVHDPVNTVLMQTSLANIDSVLVAGRFVKRDGRLLHSRVGEVVAGAQKIAARIAG